MMKSSTSCILDYGLKSTPSITLANIFTVQSPHSGQGVRQRGVVPSFHNKIPTVSVQKYRLGALVNTSLFADSEIKNYELSPQEDMVMRRALLRSSKLISKGKLISA